MIKKLKQIGQSKYFYWHIVAIALMVVVNMVYFWPQLEGKKLHQDDLIAAKGKSAEVREYKEDESDFLLWTNSQFGGMPRLLFVPVKNNVLVPAYDLLTLDFYSPIGEFNVMLIGMYLLMMVLGLHPLAGMLLALATAFSVNNVVLWDAGHASKVRTLALLPLVISGVLLLYYRQRSYVGGAVLGVGLALIVYMQHTQMIFYTFMIFVILGILMLIDAIRRKELRQFFISTGIVAFISILALGASASRILSVYDFNSSSMRGASVLEKEKSGDAATSNGEGTTSSGGGDGLEWDYAMQWSNSWVDLLAVYIPGAAGGSGSEKLDRDSELYKMYRMPTGPLYWGELPFTAGPNYLGAVFWFLFIFGLFYYKGPLKYWLGAAVLMTLVISMGKNIEWFNRLLFDYVPLYNKFRTPQSILSVTVFFLPILGGLSLYQLVRSQPTSGKKRKKSSPDPRLKKSLMWSAGICLGLALIPALMPSVFFNFESVQDSNYVQQGVDINALISDRKSLLVGDAWRSFFFVLLTALTLWLYQKQKLKSSLLLLGVIGALALIDNWGVSKRYVAHEDFVSDQQYDQNFQAREVDRAIMQREENRYDYRVLDLSVNTFNATFPSIFHNHVGGYHAAKLQRYQDMIEYHIRDYNREVLNMLNTKYIIVPDQQGGERFQVNNGAVGNAWAVDEIIEVSSPREEIEALNNFSAADQAVVLRSEFEEQLSGLEVSRAPDTRIQLTDYHPERLKYSFSSSRDQLVLFSEIWYGPDKGWEVTIDGEPVSPIRANYILRGLVVPSGEHEIVFEFLPKSYYQGEKIALAFSSILLLLILGGFYKGLVEERPKDE